MNDSDEAFYASLLGLLSEEDIKQLLVDIYDRRPDLFLRRLRQSKKDKQRGYSLRFWAAVARQSPMNARVVKISGRRLIWERRDSSKPTRSLESPLLPKEPTDTGTLEAGTWGRNQPSEKQNNPEWFLSASLC